MYYNEGEQFVRTRSDEKLQEAPEGILVFRADESMTYPNVGFLLRRFRDHVVSRYRYSGSMYKPLPCHWQKCGKNFKTVSRG
ncbi:hypothetical protein HK101_009836, partial [Irineochytrium annulatum]